LFPVGKKKAHKKLKVGGRGAWATAQAEKSNFVGRCPGRVRGGGGDPSSKNLHNTPGGGVSVPVGQVVAKSQKIRKRKYLDERAK